jgi:hypothetical protein
MTESCRVGIFEAGMRDQGHSETEARNLAQAFLMGRRAHQAGKPKAPPRSFAGDDCLIGSWKQGWQETEDGWF